MSTLIYRIGGCTIEVHDDIRHLRTTFPDGTYLDAGANDDDPESVNLAHELGYNGDTWAMSRDHEILHTWLASKFGLEQSPTLWSVPNRQHPDALGPEGRGSEEWLVLCFQKYLKRGLWDDTFECLINRGYQLPALREEYNDFIWDGSRRWRQ